MSGPAGGRLDGRTTLVNLAAKTAPEAGSNCSTLVNLAAKTAPEAGSNFSIASGEPPDIGRKFGVKPLGHRTAA